jgi:hypothetical protein
MLKTLFERQNLLNFNIKKILEKTKFQNLMIFPSFYGKIIESTAILIIFRVALSSIQISTDNPQKICIKKFS